MGDHDHVTTKDVFKKANTGLAHTYQMINVEDFEVRKKQFSDTTIPNKRKIYINNASNNLFAGKRRKCPHCALLSKYGGG